MPIPNSHPEAMKSTFAKFWADAEQSERKDLLEKECYEIVDLPAGEKIIKFKWVYAVKGSSKGHVVRFKARLTARGDLVDIDDLDFDDVFSPVVSWEGVRTYLAIQFFWDSFHYSWTSIWPTCMPIWTRQCTWKHQKILVYRKEKSSS